MSEARGREARLRPRVRLPVPGHRAGQLAAGRGPHQPGRHHAVRRSLPVRRDHRRPPAAGRPLRVPRGLAAPDRPAARPQPAERRRPRARAREEGRRGPPEAPRSRERLPVLRRFCFLLLVCLAGRPAPALAQLELQAFLGTSVSAPSPLWITQRGQPGLDFTAHWATRPWLDTWYYAGRIGLWSGDRGWLFDFTHHKIYLTTIRPRRSRDSDHERDEHVHAEPRVPAWRCSRTRSARGRWSPIRSTGCAVRSCRAAADSSAGTFCRVAT